MDRRTLLELLNCYSTPFQEEAAYVPRFITLIRNFPECFSRRLLSGHVTGSAWVVSPDRSKALLLHHKKLNRWLQPIISKLPLINRMTEYQFVSLLR